MTIWLGSGNGMWVEGSYATSKLTHRNILYWIFAPPDPLLTFLQAVMCLGSLTSRDFISESSGFWLGWVNGRGAAGGYLQETGGREESQVRICVPLAPSCGLELAGFLYQSFSLASLPIQFFLFHISMNHYFLLSLQTWAGNSSYHQSYQYYRNPLIVFLPLHTPLYVGSLLNLSQVTQLKCALCFLARLLPTDSLCTTLIFYPQLLADIDTLHDLENHQLMTQTLVGMGPSLSS